MPAMLHRQYVSPGTDDTRKFAHGCRPQVPREVSDVVGNDRQVERAIRRREVEPVAVGEPDAGAAETLRGPVEEERREVDADGVAAERGLVERLQQASGTASNLDDRLRGESPDLRYSRLDGSSFEPEVVQPADEVFVTGRAAARQVAFREKVPAM